MLLFFLPLIKSIKQYEQIASNYKTACMTVNAHIIDLIITLNIHDISKSDIHSFKIHRFSVSTLQLLSSFSLEAAHLFLLFTLIFQLKVMQCLPSGAQKTSTQLNHLPSQMNINCFSLHQTSQLSSERAHSDILFAVEIIL